MPYTSPDSFRVHLIDTIRSLEDAVDIQNAATQMLGRFTGANRVGYADVNQDKQNITVTLDYTNGVPSFVGSYSRKEYGEQLCTELEAGRTVTRSHIANDPILSEAEKGVHALLHLDATVNIPFLKNGQLVAILFIHFISAYYWTEEEVALFQEVAERTWDAVLRAKAESKIRLSEEQFRLAAEASHLYTWQANLKTNELFYSDNAAQELGYKELPKGLTNLTTSIDFVHPDDRENVRRTVLTSFRDGGTYSATYRLMTGSGKYVWVEARAKTHLDIGGRPISIFGVIINMNARRKADVRLQQSEDRYRIALEAGDLASWDWNITLGKVLWNAQHYKLLGIPVRDDKRKPDEFLQYIHPDDRMRVQQTLTDGVQTGLYEAEFRVIRKDNAKVRWMKGYGKVTEHNNRGTPKRMVGVMYDVTEQKQLERQKDEFIGIASHELKTPVTTIKAYAEILQEMFADKNDFESAGLMEKLDSQVDRLTNLIKDLLDTTKVIEGQLALHMETFDLMEAIRSQAEQLQRITSHHELIVLNCASVFVKADKERIIQVFVNLISNAIKYSPKGGVITIRCEKTAEEVKVSVQDSGIGIPNDMKEKIFERFSRGAINDTHNYPGIGLGLYITAAIIKRHRGEIWLDSEPGKGSTFFFTLPLHENL